MHHYLYLSVESWVAKQLRPRTLDLEAQGPSLAHRVVYLDKELYSTLSLCLWGGGGNPARDQQFNSIFIQGHPIQQSQFKSSPEPPARGGCSNTPTLQACFMLRKLVQAPAVLAFGLCVLYLLLILYLSNYLIFTAYIDLPNAKLVGTCHF